MDRIDPKSLANLSARDVAPDSIGVAKARVSPTEGGMAGDEHAYKIILWEY